MQQVSLIGFVACVFLHSHVGPKIAMAQTQPVYNDDLRKVAINAHNNKRSIVAKGEAVNKNGTKLPPATNIYKFTYSKLVETYAKSTGATCNWKHTSVNRTSNNLYLNGGSKFVDADVAIQNAVDAWYGELKSDGQSSLTLDNSNYNHFTQVVWASSKEIACAVQYCNNMTGINLGSNYVYTFVVCDYSPAGNYLDTKIYNPGTTCSKCPAHSKCESSTGLCKINNVADIHN